LGRILNQELNKGKYVLSLDGVVLSDLDFIDVGELINPPGVIPLVIKSLVFDSAQQSEH
jgi:ethanolamine utilization protein EutA